MKPRPTPAPAPRPKGPRTPRAVCDAVDAAARDRALASAVAAWFAREARDLPWRHAGPGGRRDPWRSLVSEIMLQQTQVSRVLERFEAFMRDFPTPPAMAQAGEAAVLARWSGLGYYRRARLLFAAAREISGRFGGQVPPGAQDLRSLPGVGRYTAGAVASLVFGACEPIVDGNVSRVLLRVHGLEQSAEQSVPWCWQRAHDLARAAGPEVAAFNEGMMELGAIVCTPKAPRCGACPLAGACVARREGSQERIPRPKQAARRSVVLCEVLTVRDAKGRVLVEQRGDDGMWAGLWQAPTRETAVVGGAVPAAPLFSDPLPALLASLRLSRVRVEQAEPEEFVHQTTHREVVFRVWRGLGAGPAGKGRRWVTREGLAELGRSNPQRRILEAALAVEPREPAKAAGRPAAGRRGPATGRTRGRS